ncbi:MAG: sugar kinase, partial [Nanoarchaeota archaeon]|nr:sugar kinase [Nanoarchaeota archaeon]
MVDIVFAGTIGLDDIKTPFGEVKEALGGSSIFSAYAAAFFAKPGVVSIAGEDFPEEHIKTLKNKGVDLEGVERKGRNFRWEGSYEFDMNEAKTLRTELNSLIEFDPKLPADYRKAKYLFLANVDPEMQMKVIEQMEKPEFIVMDTMNFWID